MTHTNTHADLIGFAHHQAIAISPEKSPKEPLADGARANAISPEKPAKERLTIGARVRVVIENEGKEGLYFDDDRVGIKGMTGHIAEDDKSEQPFRVKLEGTGKLSWFKEAWLEDGAARDVVLDLKSWLEINRLGINVCCRL
eukprot:Skav223103  [mRNA]  locus=scaffold419:633123:635231:+ [translate_table: standard]